MTKLELELIGVCGAIFAFTIFLTLFLAAWDEVLHEYPTCRFCKKPIPPWNDSHYEEPIHIGCIVPEAIRDSERAVSAAQADTALAYALLQYLAKCELETKNK